MTAWVWILPEVVTMIHEEQIAEHGGGSGVRDTGLLQSALARPENKALYDAEATVFDLAASYAYGLAKNHPFVDGNKRSALVVSETFLYINGWELEATDVECILMFQNLAAGNVSEDDLADWFQEHSVKL